MKVQLPDKHDSAPSPITGKAFTREESARGGREVSPAQSFATTLSQRKRCNARCIFFELCPVAAVAMSYTDAKTGLYRPCLMKQMPGTVKQQFVNFFLTGEPGVIHGIKTALHNYMVDVEAYGTLKDKRDMVQLMLQFYREVYLSPRKSGIDKEPLTITIRRVGMAPESVTIDPHKALPQGLKAHEIYAGKNADLTEGDPESLLDSPIIERLVRDKPIPRALYLEEIRIESNMERIIDDTEDS
jgi:hypothetical protein